MKKKTLPLLLALVLLLLLTTPWLITNSKVVYAEPSSTVNVKVDHVDHVVTVLDGGQVTINDTVKLSANQSGQPALVSNFSLGFPYKYKFNLDYVFAYESQNPEQRLRVDLDTGLGQIGFYGVKVNFSSTINLSRVPSYSFTIVFVFSDLITVRPLLEQMFLLFLDFPVYPSLAQEVSSSNTTVILPPNANFTASSHSFNQTTNGTRTFVKEPLDAFAFEPGNLTFTSDTFSLLEANEAKREIMLDEWEQLLVSDFYSMTNKAARDTSALRVVLPQDAYDTVALDELGNRLTLTHEKKGAATTASITLKTPLKQNQTANFQVTFKLPWKNYVNQNGWSNFNLKFTMFEPMNLTLRKLTVTINLPEGAVFQPSNAAIQPDIAQRGAYQETPTFTLNNVTSFQNLNFTITYSHVIFWAAFRPTLWTGAIVAIIGAVAFLWQAQRAPTPVPTALPIRPEELRNYVKTYEEERKIRQERETLEEQARKGKVPRRLYRVRSRTLESRLSVLSRDLAGLREKIRAVGPRYAEMMRQIEVAETELKGAEADIRRAEVSYRRGELSPAAYRQLLEGAYRRRDRAKTNIDGVLLRLREEIV